MTVTVNPRYFRNVASTRVAGGAAGLGTQLNAADNSVHISSGDGAAKCPTSLPCSAILGDPTSGPWEVVNVTARSTDTLTITRAYEEGTAHPAANWAVNSPLTFVQSAGDMNAIISALVALAALTAPGSADDTLIGNRTVNEGITVGTTNTDTLTNLLSKIVAQLLLVGGGSHWYSAPATTLAAIVTSLAAKAGLTTNTFTGAQEIDRTLSGATKTFLTMKATDGKTYDFRQDTSNNIILYNVTDSVAVMTLSSAGNATFPGNGIFSGNFVFGPLVSGSQAFGGTDTTNHWTAIWTPQAGASHYSEIFVVYNGTAGVVALQLGGTSNNSAALVWIDESGNMHFGVQFLNVDSSAQTIATNGTIALTSGKGVLRVTNSGAVTGVILAAGTDGEEITIVNKGTGSVTFAASGTSHVADGASSSIAAGTAATFVYSNAESLWYHCK